MGVIVGGPSCHGCCREKEGWPSGRTGCRSRTRHSSYAWPAYYHHNYSLSQLQIVQLFPNKELQKCLPARSLPQSERVSLWTRRKLPTPLTTDNQPATNIPLFVHTHLDDGLSIDEATLKLVKELRTYLVTAQALHLPKDTLAGIVL